MKSRYLLLLSAFLFPACQNANQSADESLSQKDSRVLGCYPPKTTDKEWYSSGQKAPKLNGLKGIQFAISTNNKEVQDYFNQGMMLSYGFNHAEAARSFFEATRLDPTCAMAWWGFAYVLGPNYNGGMEEDNFQRAYAAAKKAKELSGNISAREAALVEALFQRYLPQPPADRSALDIAYANAMKKVYDQYPDDPDIGALYAESLMDLHPWDLYEKETKLPRPWTPEVLTILEHLMTIHPNHPGAHHFYIHAVEASAHPEKALASAKLLETLVPGSGHLVHMPSHIYINTGNYHEGTLSNMRAVQADSLYVTTCHAQGAYPLAYYPHNFHFLAATATLEGNAQLAWMASRKLQEGTAEEIMRMPGWSTLQHYYSIPYYVAVKFALWDSIAVLPTPPPDLVYPRAIWHYARGMAFLGKHDLQSAKQEMVVLDSLAADSSLQQLSIWDINTTADLVQIARRVLQAEISATQHQTAKAITLLREAAWIEDRLNYNEPPDWFFSVRHYLGYRLLQSAQYYEAETVYRQDLKTWKKNGWALMGLYQALSQQQKWDAAASIKSAFDESWQYADIPLTSSVAAAD